MIWTSKKKLGQKFLSNLRIVKAARCIILIWLYPVFTATEKAARSQYEMAKNGAQREDKAAAAAQVERAKGAVAEVSSYCFWNLIF